MLKMFINNVNKKEEIKNIALRNLRKYGIKHRVKATRHPTQVAKSKKLFKVPLQNLENETITLKNGQQLVIPKRLCELCSFILTKVDTEGIFRKEGSKSRQNEIKLSLDRGCPLGTEHHVIDVSVVLKSFFRELPEPLIPYAYHELFLRCSLVEHKVDAMLLACLLLPNEHVNVLSFLMQFLDEVSSHAKYNKMNSYNLAVLIGPNIFPVNEKIVPKNKLMFKKICDIVKLMIDNSKHIGVIPDNIIEQIGNLRSGESETTDRAKRRRSRSLTRIFNGLKKIVTNRTEDEVTAVNTVTPDLLLTPLNYSVKKREILKTREDEREPAVNRKTVLERRWSAITTATNSLRRKKRDSLIYHLKSDSNLSSNSLISINSSVEGEYVKLLNDGANKVSMMKAPTKIPVKNDMVCNTSADYVRVSKTEYEDIKNRVSEIEKRLSKEFETASNSTIIHNKVNIINDIQTAYEKTLNEMQDFSPGTDQLARRLSKELRIRTTDQKPIRSPSARKIGNIRRRSKEFDKPNSSSYGSSMSLLNNNNGKCAKRSQSLKRTSPVTSNLPTNISSPRDTAYKGMASLTRSVSLPRSDLSKGIPPPYTESPKRTPVFARTSSSEVPATNRIAINSNIDMKTHILIPSPSRAGSSFERSHVQMTHSPGFRSKNPSTNIRKLYGSYSSSCSEDKISPRSKVIRSRDRVGIVKRYSNNCHSTKGSCVNKLKRKFEEGCFDISDEENTEVNYVNVTPRRSTKRASDVSDDDANPISKLPQFKRALPVVRTPKRVFGTCTPKGSRMATPLKCLPDKRTYSDV